jgi:hypothetical protein
MVATASIDPVFSFARGVDPAYSFQFSDGIGNSSIAAIPEPSPVVLLSASAIAMASCAGAPDSGASRRRECLCSEVSSAATVSAFEALVLSNFLAKPSELAEEDAYLAGQRACPTKNRQFLHLLDLILGQTKT